MKPSAIDRFTTALERLAPGFATSDARLGIAVSGGPDSLALLWLAAQAYPGRVHAATFDHGLRPESAGEAAMVADVCAGLSVSHTILRPELPITGSIQANARLARYHHLREWAETRDIAWITTAHHADDQLETVLMRLNRGAGLDGLSGVREKNGAILRPLLGYRKTELVEICALAGLQPVDDPSNSDADYDRVAMRKALQNMDILDPMGAVQSAAALAEAGAALDWLVVREMAAFCATQNGCATLSQTDYPAEIQRRLLIACLRIIQPDLTPRGPALQALLAGLILGETRSIGAVVCTGGPVWTFRPAPPRRTANTVIG